MVSTTTALRTAVVAAVAAAALGTVPASAQVPDPTPTPTATAAPTAGPQRIDGEALATFPAFDANQGVAVDAEHFYAVDNQRITRHDRATGAPELQFVGEEDGPIEHLDSGVVVDGLLYAAHSNYPGSPIQSSIEVFDTATLEHVATHSFGIFRGSLTWLDRHQDGTWWAGFANYDRIQTGETEPYGGTRNTQVVQMDEQWNVLQSFTIPAEILEEFELMSNSGGSWGPDGRLWLSGHDLPEAYAMTPPAAGSELEWVATASLPAIQGQGIAWDLASTTQGGPTLWGISREDSAVVAFDIPVEEITGTPQQEWDVRGPGAFQLS